MTIPYTVFNNATGEILRTGTASSMAQALLQGNAPGTSVTTVGSDPETQVVDVTPIPAGQDPNTLPKSPITVNGVQIAASKTDLLANGVDAVTISPIPVGATFVLVLPSGRGIDTINPGTINDGSLILTTTVAGVYAVTVKYGTNLDFQVTLNAS